MKIFLHIILIGLFVVSCKNKDSNQKNNADSTSVKDTLRSDTQLSAELIEKAPEWYKSLPEEEGFIYVVGVAKSRRGDIASNKALLKAQVNLAERIEELRSITSNNKQELSLGADSDPSNNNLEILMQDVVVKEKKKFKYGNLWYSFVLLELNVEK